MGCGRVTDEIHRNPDEILSKTIDRQFLSQSGGQGGQGQVVFFINMKKVIFFYFFFLFFFHFFV